ncbi:MAG TPA: AAA family ATPase [Solirubrobacterales bacterium]|nr:AAA family ATPase [Solirubrobacterales bacterium]
MAGSTLRGRQAELEALQRVLEAARAGESRTLVLRGEAGSGKTALLEQLVDRAAGFRVAAATGIESEMELPFATLHQLCAPLLDRLDHLPPPQRAALASVFGMSGGEAPDRFLVGLATLGLLSDAAEAEPLLCVIDDAQWLDRASAQVLGFVARRLLADPVALVFATREEGGELSDLPELAVEGLSGEDARELLDSVLTGPIDEQVKERIIAETRGNPLALLELPKGSTPAELAGGFGLTGAAPLSGRIEGSFRRRIEVLPSPTQTLLLVAATEPVGEPALIQRAADDLGVGGEAWAPATEAGLIELGPRVRFRHPLVRSAVYRAATPRRRAAAHEALADATDPALDPDRRAWHRADASLGPDESIAAELEGSAARAQGRGGVAAAAAFLERAAALTPDPTARAGRALEAAAAKHEAGAPEAGLRLLAMAEAGPLDDLQRARADLLRARIAFAQRRGRDAPPLLLRAAKQLEPLDGMLARETYLEALAAAQFAGRLALDGDVATAARAARGAPPATGRPRPLDLLLDGLVVLITEGHEAAVPILRPALEAFSRDDLSVEETLRWSWLACRTAIDLWDFATWEVLSSRLLARAHETGALVALPFGLGLRLSYELHAGNPRRAAALGQELEEVTRATGATLAPYGEMLLAGWRGPEDEALAILESSAREVTERGEGIGLTFAERMTATLYNGLGRYDEAMVAAEQASRRPEDLNFGNAALVELVEAAARAGDLARASAAFERLADTTRPSGTDWGLGIEARTRALVEDGDDAERLYREAIERLGRAGVRIELARARLLYGEWLRREGRRLDAREQLRAAHAELEAFGAAPFAERAARELAATGETARRRSPETRDELTPRETQIARLARDGLSNPEIAGRLFISPRTVEYHLHKVFGKLAIASRGELRYVFGDDA